MDKLSLILSGAAVLLNLVVLLVLLFRGRERRDALTYDQLRRELAEQNRLTAQQVSLLGQELDTSFKNAGQIIGTNIDQMTRMVDRRLQSLQEDNARKLDSMRQTVDEKLQKTLETRLGESFKAVGDQLERVYKGLGDMQSLAAGVGDLKKVLTNVKTRGTWGEISLGSLLEQVLTPQQYRANVKVAPRRGEIVEYAICLPGKEDGADTVYLPIDSKFPMESYIRLTEAAERGEPAEVDTASRQLEASIKENARSIRDKYIVPPHTTDFAIMFLPTEGLYAEVTRRAELCTVLQDARGDQSGFRPVWGRAGGDAEKAFRGDRQFGQSRQTDRNHPEQAAKRGGAAGNRSGGSPGRAALPVTGGVALRL